MVVSSLVGEISRNSVKGQAFTNGEPYVEWVNPDETLASEAMHLTRQWIERERAKLSKLPI